MKARLEQLRDDLATDALTEARLWEAVDEASLLLGDVRINPLAGNDHVLRTLLNAVNNQLRQHEFTARAAPVPT